MTEMSPHKEPKECTLLTTAKKIKTNITLTEKKMKAMTTQKVTLEIYINLNKCL